MSDTPDISVVMSVYNGAPRLRETIESVLNQEGVSLEFIIVNDGSTDESPMILEQYANQDFRLRVIHQDNQGLTRALIKGCARARGRYIARQDVGDRSLARRLESQVSEAKESSNPALVSCGTRFVGPKGEHMYDVNDDPAQATERLLTLDLAQIKGPSIHGSTLFPTALYRLVGGYRPEFYFAQDLDLWIRLVEYGRHIVLKETLYQASVTAESISALRRKEQIETARAILECARLRRLGLDEGPALARAKAIRPSGRSHDARLGRANALYFIGVCLRKRRNPRARTYFREALRAYPLHLKSAARLLLG